MRRDPPRELNGIGGYPCTSSTRIISFVEVFFSVGLGTATTCTHGRDIIRRFKEKMALPPWATKQHSTIASRDRGTSLWLFCFCIVPFLPYSNVTQRTHTTHNQHLQRAKRHGPWFHWKEIPPRRRSSTSALRYKEA